MAAQRGSGVKRIAGWLGTLCYKLQNHYLLGVSLRNWLWLWVLGPPVLSAFGRLPWTRAILVSVGAGLALAGIELSRRRNYLVFEPAHLGEGENEAPPIQVDEQVAGWASGLFRVGKKLKYVVNEPAQYSYVRSREHMVMVHVRQTRFFLLAKSARSEAGWWYAFLEPERVQAAETGYVWAGLRARPGLALSYWAQGLPSQPSTICLAFADRETVQRVLADLRIDAPQGAIIDR